MENQENITHRFDSLSKLHSVLGLPAPMHPLVSLINNLDGKVPLQNLPNPHFLNFYKISYKMNFSGKLRYGQHFYDFAEGGLFFASPNQTIGLHDTIGDYSAYTLLIHPDFLLGYSLAKKIKLYGFFFYSVNEALHLSGNEKTTIISVFQIIEEELKSRIDDFSQDVIISQIELLLNHSNRFYKRQFITRKAVNSDLLQKLEEILDDYFNNEKSLMQGIPTVQYLAEQLNISASYLSDMLRSLTKQNAQQHIHGRLIEKAKELLSTTNLTVSEVAYQLGFEYPQPFSKLFRTKVKLSPLEFKHSFN